MGSSTTVLALSSARVSERSAWRAAAVAETVTRSLVWPTSRRAFSRVTLLIFTVMPVRVSERKPEAVMAML